MASVKIAFSPNVSFGIRLLSNMNRILLRVFENLPGICFYEEVFAGGHRMSRFSDKQVISVKIALSLKASFGIRLLSNMNRILTRAF